MLNDELEHRLGVSQSLSSVQSKEAERQEIERLTREWEASGNEVKRFPSTDWTPDATSFNREGPLNAAKFEGRWDNHDIAKNYRV